MQAGKRPCSIPTIQIDTWKASKERSCSEERVSPSALAEEVCVQHRNNVVASLLRNATTIKDYVSVLQRIYSPLDVHIKSGQLYLNSKWRLRFHDMTAEIQRMVLCLSESETYSKRDLQDAFGRVYQADKMAVELYRAIGPARSEGTKSLFQHLQQALSRSLAE